IPAELRRSIRRGDPMGRPGGPPDRSYEIPMIVLCDVAEQPFTRDSLFRGEVSAVLSAKASSNQLVAAAAAAIAGLQVHQRWDQTISANAHPILTPREIEILRLLADGEGNKTIADLLNISPHTVKFHISSIFEKLNVLNRTEAVRTGITLGLLSI